MFSHWGTLQENHEQTFTVAFSVQILHLQLRREFLLHLSQDREGGKCPGRWWVCAEAAPSQAFHYLYHKFCSAKCNDRLNRFLMLNEQHVAELLHWRPGSQWSEDVPGHAKTHFQRLGPRVWQACWSGSQMNLSFKNRLPIARRNKSALSPYRVRECFVVVLCGSELRLLPSWVSSFSVFQHGCNTWKHAVWEKSK